MLWESSSLVTLTSSQSRCIDQWHTLTDWKQEKSKACEHSGRRGTAAEHRTSVWISRGWRCRWLRQHCSSGTGSIFLLSQYLGGVGVMFHTQNQFKAWKWKAICFDNMFSLCFFVFTFPNLWTARRNRTVASTDMNLHSSRSHLAVRSWALNEAVSAPTWAMKKTLVVLGYVGDYTTQLYTWGL